MRSTGIGGSTGRAMPGRRPRFASSWPTRSCLSGHSACAAASGAAYPRGTTLHQSLLGSFTCGDIPSYDDSTEDTKTDDCSVPEDPNAAAAMQPEWICTLTQPPFLISSPAQQFLGDYFADGVGISPSSENPKAPEKSTRQQNGNSDTTTTSTSECYLEPGEASALHEFF
ncbi:lysine-specific histone demethylase 1B-like [Rhipicephalus sanguineus]|uniref:lysine-specific histone demethylase 1B-like n=1 Tax=Rhipicephalus sanguineus TaxID=34632 RepID=UPI0018952EE5|nr:lysine-specific histone demethylase 1B-like [Rhipicephalus sanguineus]